MCSEASAGAWAEGLLAEAAPLSPSALERVAGVLGEISRARAADYASVAALPTVGALARPAAKASFTAALSGRARSGAAPAFIAEVKRASPSQGAITAAEPLALARAYAAAGAEALSVLTEPRRFGGELAHLLQVATDVPLPALRKDFVVHPRQLQEAAEAGAKAALLIVAVLGQATGAYLRYASALGLDALVEVHDVAELEVALEAGADLIGVNNRDLRSLHIDLGTAPRLIEEGRLMAKLPVVWVAESGYREAAQVEALTGQADAVLVGTSLASSSDPAAAMRALRQPRGGGS